MAAPSAIAVRDLSGPTLTDALDRLGELRIAVFRDFPYLYDGDAAYEREYLTAYIDSPNALVVGAFAPTPNGGQLVGAATAAPMADHMPECAEPFRARGIDISSIYYFGESVLLPQWRGQGIGRAFFDRREARARERGFAHVAFCAVIRSATHPARPANYNPLNSFWRRLGFTPREGLIGQFDWKDIGDTGETAHPMQFWIKTLRA
jgi:GNAT superfamily N-acetyltransferase